MNKGHTNEGRIWTRWAIAAVLTTALPSHFSHADIMYTGVNLAGAEFGVYDTTGASGNLPGTFGSDYTYPTFAEIDYFASKGLNTIRLPFRWERLQQTLLGSFDPAEFNRLNGVVEYATSRGLHVILDPHNYARYSLGNNVRLIGSDIPNSTFADLWGRLANVYKANDKVIFGLMNEPHSMATEQWVVAASAAIDAIRGAAAGNLILVPGNGYSGAHSWYQNYYGTPNASAMQPIIAKNDPNLAFEAHQYFDGDSSGNSSFAVSPEVVRQRLGEFNSWLENTGQKGFLGEFGAASTSQGLLALETALEYMEDNSDNWIGWTYWAAGPWWGDYMFSVEPGGGPGNYIDKPQIAVLAEYAVPEPSPGLFVLSGALIVGLLARFRRRLIFEKEAAQV